MTVTVLGHPHRRRNPLTGRWVLVSPHRTDRPWQGQQEPAAAATRPAYDPSCYLCPGNERAHGERNPTYASTFVFANDFPALQPQTPGGTFAPHPLLRAHTEAGLCRVLCFSPRHDLDLAELDVAGVEAVVELWAEQVTELNVRYRWVQVFENRGQAMGASNPHPHGQLWATAELPHEPAGEDHHQRAYHDSNGVPLLVDYAAQEAADGSRHVVENEHWLAVVPFWAVWPFETLVLPRRHVPALPDLTAAERTSLAQLLRGLLARYDNLFEQPFPYSMGWHGAPGLTEGGRRYWQLHAHLYPPLLRSAAVRKFLVGYEMLADVQRDLTAEDAAARLRAQPDVHHRHPPGPHP